jgi:hypothetical protein
MDGGGIGARLEHTARSGANAAVASRGDGRAGTPSQPRHGIAAPPSDDSSASRAQGVGGPPCRAGVWALGRPGQRGLDTKGRGLDPDVPRELQLDQIRTAMRLNPWLASVPPEQAEALASVSLRRAFEAGAAILDARNRREGQLFLVLAGEVALIERRSDGGGADRGGDGDGDGERDADENGGGEMSSVVGAGSMLGPGAGAVGVARAAGLAADWAAPDAGAGADARMARVAAAGLALRCAHTAWGRRAGALLVLERGAIARALAPALRARRAAVAATLRAAPLLGKLAPAALRRLADCARAEDAGPGDCLASAGAGARALRVLSAGAARVTFRSECAGDAGACSVGGPSPPPPSRTKWTRLVHPSVLTGHVSSLSPIGWWPLGEVCARPAEATSAVVSPDAHAARVSGAHGAAAWVAFGRAEARAECLAALGAAEGARRALLAAPYGAEEGEGEGEGEEEGDAADARARARACVSRDAACPISTG